jgi:hypothetical protein
MNESEYQKDFLGFAISDLGFESQLFAPGKSEI